MTFDEARRLFPLLENVAYLNAGTFGPLAEPVAKAQAEALERDVERGRSGLDYFEETMALRAELRGSLASLVGAQGEQVALTGSTTDGCGIVLRGLGLGPGDEIVTTTDEHFGLLGPVGGLGCHRRRGRARPGGHPRRRHAPNTADRDVAGALDLGRGPTARRGP